MAATTKNLPTNLPCDSFALPAPHRRHPHHRQQKNTHKRHTQKTHTENGFSEKKKDNCKRKGQKKVREGERKCCCCDDANQKNLPVLFCRPCRHHGGLFRVGNGKMKIGVDREKVSTSKLIFGEKVGGLDPKFYKDSTVKDVINLRVHDN